MSDYIPPASSRLRASGVIYADQVEVGDIVFASYAVSENGRRPLEAQRTPTDDGTLVCAWVRVNEIKHHSDATVTMFSSVLDEPGKTHRWVEYPRDAPMVLGLERGDA